MKEIEYNSNIACPGNEGQSLSGLYITTGITMTTDNITQKQTDSNASFVAIKWAETLRLETEYKCPPSWIQLYPVIASFQINGCYLSQDKLAAYAGMRKEDIKPTILNLIENGWLMVESNNHKQTYKITNQYFPHFAFRFYMIGTELIKNGVWGALGKTRQVIYSILQAFSKHSAYIDPYCAFSDSEPDFSFLENMYVNGIYPVKNCSFLYSEWYDPDKIISSAKNCRIDCSKKKFQRAIKVLQDLELMIYHTEADGYFFPRNPGLKVDGFDERLKKIEKAQKEHKISYAAKRAVIASKKRNQENKGNSKFVKN